MAGEWQTLTIKDIAEKVAMGPFGSSIKVETFVPGRYTHHQWSALARFQSR